MKNKVIESILKAETEAENIQQQAKEQALKKVADAEAKSDKEKNGLVEASKQILKNQIAEFENKSIREFEENLNSYYEQADRIASSAKLNFDNAIKILLQKI